MAFKKMSYSLLGSLILCSAADVSAEAVTLQITATVYNIYDSDNALGGSVNMGDKITGTYTIDVSVPDTDPNPEYGHYIQTSSPGSSPQLGFDLLLGPHSLKSDPTNTAHMYEAHIMNSYADHFGLWSWGNMPLTNGSTVDDVVVDLYDGTGLVLSSDQLNAQAPDVTAFEFHDIHVSGRSVTGNHFSVDAKIDLITASDGECLPSTLPIVKFGVNATVREIWDDQNVLNGTIRPGDVVSGTYTFNINTPDTDSHPDYGRYEHVPGSGDYGFDINWSGANIRTNTATDLFTITVSNGAPSPDFYAVEQFGTNIPFINGTVVDGTGIFVDDPTGVMFNSAALAATPPNISAAGYKDFYMSGWGDTSTGTSYFSIIADVSSITEVSSCDETASPTTISPGDGLYDRAQRFDAAIIFHPGLPPLMQMSGSLNGINVTGELNGCFPGAPNSENRQTLVCPNFSDLLMQGSNTLSITFTLGDGRVINDSANWQVIGY